nr:hypothetical protein [Tanacetum cinerariifolium]GEX45163.1 hypothetical protein [Tanacetum cinerariifolium]
MRIRSSSFNPVGESSPNPTTTNSKCRKRRRSKQPFIHEESPIDTMADQCTMVELLRAPTEGYAEAIMVPPILAEHFELKLNQQTSAVTTAMTAILKQFQATPPPASVKAIEKICVTCGAAVNYNEGNFGHRPSGVDNQIRPLGFAQPNVQNNQNRFSQPQGYNRGNNFNQDSSYQAPMQQNHVVPFSELEKIKKMNEINMKAMQTQINNVKNELRNEMKPSIQASMSNQTNEVKNVMASFFQMNSASTSHSGPLPSNTITNPKGELKAITTRSGLVLDGPFIPMPPPFINPKEDERVKETLTDPDLTEYTIKQEKHEVQIHKFWQMFKQLHINITLADDLILIPKYQKMLKAFLSNKEKLLELANTPLNENCSMIILKKLPEKLGDLGKFLIPYGFSELKCKALADLGASINLMPLSVWKKLGLPELIFTRMTLELANRAICTPTGIARDVFVPFRKFTFPADFVIVDYESDPRVSLVLGRPFLQTARALIDVHKEETILRDDDERLTLNMRHATSSYSNQPQKESTNMINIFDDSCEKYLEDLFATNHLSGNLTFSSHTDLTLPDIKDDIFDQEGDIVLIEKLINLDSTKDLPPPHNINPLSGSTTSSFPSHLLEEFADELALITLPLGNDDLSFDIESDLRETEYFLNHDPIKEMDSILEDSIDESNLVSPNDNLFDTIPDMFTDEHALDYSSPPIYDDFDDDLDEFESSDFLPVLEYDSFIFKDFSEVDALPSTNNEDKVFNPGILIHENLSEVITRVALDKNEKKIAISHASIIIEDFDPPLSDHELLSTKKFPGPKLYSRFHLKMRKKFSNPGFSLLKVFILLFSRNYLIGALKFLKSLKFIKARWRFFLALLERTSVSWMFRVSISIPHEQFNSGVGSS